MSHCNNKSNVVAKEFVLLNMSNTQLNVYTATKCVFSISFLLGVASPVAFNPTKNLYKTILKIAHVFIFLITLVSIGATFYCIPERQSVDYETELDRNVLYMIVVNYILIDISVIIYNITFIYKYKQICTRICLISDLLKSCNIETNWKLLQIFSLKFLIATYGLVFIYIVFDFYVFGIDGAIQIFFCHSMVITTAVNCQILLLLQSIQVFSSHIYSNFVKILGGNRNFFQTLIKLHYEIVSVSRLVNRMFNVYFMMQILTTFYSIIYTAFYIVLDILGKGHGYLYVVDCVIWSISYLFPVVLVVLLCERIQRQVCLTHL